MSLITRTTSQAFQYASFVAIGLVLSFITFPIMTRIFTVEEYGQLALFNAVLALLIPFAKSGMTTAVIKEYAQIANAEEKPALYTSSLSGVVFCSFCTFIVYYGITLFAKEYVALDVDYYLLIVAVLLLSRTVLSLFASFFRAEEKVLLLGIISLTSRSGTMIVSIAACVLLKKGLYGYLLGLFVFEAIAALALALHFQRKGDLNIKRISPQLLKKLFIYGIPLIFFEVSSLLNDYADRFFIQYFLDSAQLGIYSVGYNISTYIQGFITGPLWMTIFPIYTKLWESEGRKKTTEYLEVLLKYYLCLAVLIICGVLSVSEEFIVVFATEKYLLAAQIVPLVTASILIYGTYHITGAGFFLLKKTKIIAGYTMCCALLHAALNIYLIPNYQIQGAVISAMISYSVLTALITLHSNRILRLKWPVKDLAVYLSFALVIGLLAHRLKTGSAISLLVLRSLLITVLYVAALFAYDAKLKHTAIAWVRDKWLQRKKGSVG
ncbi:MAG TPA: flippase [bacterium]|nr:flippase [bacterium]HPR87757.1 flippase [bacterium]